MRPRSIIFLIVVLTLMTCLFFRRLHPSGNAPSPADAAAFHSTDTATASGAGQTNLQTFHPVAQPTTYSTNNVFDETRIQEPGYSDRVKKTMALRDLRNSPAKDTPECRQIVELLAAEGIGLYAVRDAYNAAWDHKSKHSMIDQAKTESSKASAAEGVEMYRFQSEVGLRESYGITNQVFFDRLFSIKPKVFFGMRNMSPPIGEVLLE